MLRLSAATPGGSTCTYTRNNRALVESSFCVDIISASLSLHHRRSQKFRTLATGVMYDLEGLPGGKDHSKMKTKVFARFVVGWRIFQALDGPLGWALSGLRWAPKSMGWALSGTKRVREV